MHPKSGNRSQTQLNVFEELLVEVRVEMENV